MVLGDASVWYSCFVELKTFCADIGSAKSGNFGWASVDATGATLGSGTDMSELAAAVADAAADGPVALGFECPLFVPLRSEPERLLLGRKGEGNRAWSAGAGSGALATGLVQVSWLLTRIRAMRVPPPKAFVGWPEFVNEGSGLFLWEAFVSGPGKSRRAENQHVADATAAAQAFARALPDPTSVNAIDEAEVVSLIGMALLRSAWTTDVTWLSRPCLVVRP